MMAWVQSAHKVCPLVQANQEQYCASDPEADNWMRKSESCRPY
jgi:hypothetical protein